MYCFSLPLLSYESDMLVIGVCDIRDMYSAMSVRAWRIPALYIHIFIINISYLSKLKCWDDDEDDTTEDEENAIAMRKECIRLLLDYLEHLASWVVTGPGEKGTNQKHYYLGTQTGCHNKVIWDNIIKSSCISKHNSSNCIKTTTTTKYLLQWRLWVFNKNQPFTSA